MRTLANAGPAVRVTAGVVIALLCAGSAGCARRHAGVAAASVIDVCFGYEEYLKTDEPDVTDAEAVRRYAADVDHLSQAVDARVETPNGRPPERLTKELELLGAAARRLGADASTADRTKLAAALSRFANDSDAQQAERDFAAVHEKYCPHGTGDGR